MSAAPSETAGPDLTLGVAVDAIADGSMLAGHVGEEAVLLARRGNGARGGAGGTNTLGHCRCRRH